MPAVVEVGLTVACPAQTFCQAPGAPPEPDQQAAAAPATNPFVSTCRHWVEPVMVLMVRAPATVTAPLSLVVPRTPKVVEGTTPTPTWGLSTFTTRVSLVGRPKMLEVAMAMPKPSAGVMVATF